MYVNKFHSTDIISEFQSSSVAYSMYNDQPPSGSSGKENGHTKGKFA